MQKICINFQKGETNFMISQVQHLLIRALQDKSPLFNQNLSQDDIDKFTELFLYSMRNSSCNGNKKVKIDLDSPSSETREKIEQFVSDYYFNFLVASDNGLPLAKLDTTLALSVLRELSNEKFFPLIALLNEMALNSELDFKVQTSEVLRSMDAREIYCSCYALAMKLKEKNAKKSGFHLLWLIKTLLECHFEIPNSGTVNLKLVQNTLTEFFLKKAENLKKPEAFLEIFHSRLSRVQLPLFKLLLHKEFHEAFLKYTVMNLQKIPMSSWPKKKALIFNVVETLDTNGKWYLSERLNMSKDEETARLGSHFLKILKAANYNDALPILKKLLKDTSLPIQSAEFAFRLPFCEMCCSKQVYSNDPHFTKRLSFKNSEGFFKCGQLIVGVYKSKISIIPPYLFAFDTKSEHLIWGAKLPLDSPTLNRFEDAITLDCLGQSTLSIIDSQSGNIQFSLEFPYKKALQKDQFYLASKDFAYQLVHQNGVPLLVGGKVSDHKLVQSFETTAPDGECLRLGTHIGFHNKGTNKITVYSPSGHSTLFDGISAKAYENILYMIEPSSHCENSCMLTLRNLPIDGKLAVSEPLLTIQLKVKSASIECVSENHLLVLVGQHKPVEKAIFVNLDSKEVVYSNDRLSPKEQRVVNTTNGDIWTWDKGSKMIQKINAEESKMKGKLEDASCAHLLYCDGDERLYFIEAFN